MGAEVWLNAWGAPLRVRLTGNQTARRGYSNNIGVMDVPPYTVARTGGVLPTPATHSIWTVLKTGDTLKYP